jgi:aminodeoxyfutalosine synthase
LRDLSDSLRRRIGRAGLDDLLGKVEGGERLTVEDGCRLYRHPDLTAVGALADRVRERLHGDRVYWVRNQHINYTNVCNKGCRFCAFQARPKDPRGYVLDPEQVRERVREHLDRPIREIHMVAGINPRLPYSYYLDILQAVRELRPEVQIKAFTMIELDQIARVARRPLAEVLPELKAAGLAAVPGGGAEVFADDVHEELFRAKLDSTQWMEVARAVHAAGIPSNATLLYGIGESVEDKARHLARLRELQDETGGILAFIPLAFHPYGTEMDHLPPPTGVQDLREIALARLMLDNVPHVKAYWIMLSPEVAQIALWYGASDVDGTVLREEIVHEAGAETPQALTHEGLMGLIREAGRTPVERDALYGEVGE